MATKKRGRPRKPRPAPPKRKPRAKQGYLDPDMAPKYNPAVETAAEDFVSARDARMAMGRTEEEKQNFLKELMHSQGLEEYEYDGKLIKFDRKEKVVVRKVKDKDAEDHDEDDTATVEE